MKFFRYIRCLRHKSYIKKYLSNYTYAAPVRLAIINNHVIKTPVKHHNVGRYSTETDDESEDFSSVESETLDIMDQAKNVLFKEFDSDSIVNQLNNCTNVNEVWGVLKENKSELTEIHITQSILALKDLQKTYTNRNSSGANTSFEFLDEIKNSEEFKELLNAILTRLENFNPQLLSYSFLYLQRLGMNIGETPMVQISEKLKDSLENKFNLPVCSRWLRVIFLENSVRPYYMSLNLIPMILQALDKCSLVDDLSHISVCLSKLHNMVTPAVLKKYTDIVETFLNQKKLDASDHNAILKIISFLSMPFWRDENVKLMSRCMLLLKNEANRLDTPYLLLLYEVFFNIQEPGDLLNDIQRSAAKTWQQFEESGNLDMNTALKLFSALLFFSSPLHRIELRKNVKKLLKPNSDIRNLILIRKIFSYVKISDKRLCNKYWDISSSLLNEESDIFLIVKICLNYMQFHIDIDNYRNFEFEKQILELIKNAIERDDIILPSELCTCLAFVIYYSNDNTLMQVLLNKLKENPSQIKTREILALSQTFSSWSNSCSKDNFQELDDILTKSTEHLINTNENHFETYCKLIKAAILRNNYNNYSIENLFNKLKEADYMSSKLIENIHFIFLYTNTLIPEVFNKVTEYVVANKNNIIGFNAEKVLFLCFHLAYYPINADKFFQAVTDIIIRDQERLSGLAFVQSALSLSFFNKLPSFLVKQIFNVEFMDRLDNELANCYSKEKYPQRVRQTLMYLNRTVCLEYPEFNIPWFHEKFLKEVQKRFEPEHNLPMFIKDYLTEIAGQNVLENVLTPYGYHIDFVVNLNKENKVIPPDSEYIRKRVALLIIKQYAFTRFYSHLRGTYQMKIKHLEILGYSVSILKFDDWANLLYKTERLDYLKQLIWPDNYGIIHARRR